MTRPAPVVLVSGGNRGIGFAACRALASAGAKVLLGARKPAEGERAARELAKAGSIAPVTLDVADEKSVAALKARIEKEHGALDVLINNAGVYADGGAKVLDVSEETVEKTLSTNLLGAWRLCRAFAPAMGADAPAYRVSKAALNALTLVLAAELQPSGVSVVSFCPGWVATDMGGASAPRTPKSAGEALAAAALDDERTGVFLRDGQVIPW